jgi:mannose-1-phosphate guanylyltransferase
MLRQTIRRLEGLVSVDRIFVITNAEQRESVLEICPELQADRVIGEPIGRDTAAAVGLAALLVANEGKDASFALLPADHVIEDNTGFQATLETAFEAAETEDQLVTVGIKPTFPSTGYGYLEKGKNLADYDGSEVAEVNRFVEKPNLEKAQEYLKAGNYFWNAGMFVWRPAVILAEIERLVPKLATGLKSLGEKWQSSKSLEQAMATVYPNLEKISIDFAVMEKAERVAMVESSFDWDDVGEWPAIERHYPKDENGNVFKGEGIALESWDNLTFSETGHSITLLGVKDLIVVQSGDATMVCHKDKAQEVKALAQAVGNQNPSLI